MPPPSKMPGAYSVAGYSLKVYGYTFMGISSAIFIFTSLVDWGQLCKKEEFASPGARYLMSILHF